VQFPELFVCSVVESLSDRLEKLPVVYLQLDLVAKRLDASVLERIEHISGGADVVDPSQRVGIVQIIGRSTIISANGLIARLDAPKNGVDCFALVVSAGHRRSRSLLPALKPGACGDIEDNVRQLGGRVLQVGKDEIDLREPLTTEADVFADLAAIVLADDHWNQIFQVAVDQEVQIAPRQGSAMKIVIDHLARGEHEDDLSVVEAVDEHPIQRLYVFMTTAKCVSGIVKLPKTLHSDRLRPAIAA
jgi:hypothetical protein